MQTVAFCEIDKFCQCVLKKHWPDVPIYEGINNVTAERLAADGITDINIITGGPPCQPYSVAGQRRGANDDRALWPEMFRVIQEVRPRWVIGENVAGFVNLGLDDCLSSLEGEGYEVQTFIIPACAVGAPHRRDRVWIVGYAAGERLCRGCENGGGFSSGLHRKGIEPDILIANTEYAKSARFKQYGGEVLSKQETGLCRKAHTWSELWIEVATCLCRVDDGLPSTLDITKVMAYIYNHGTERQVEMAKAIAAFGKDRKMRTLWLYLDVAATSCGLEKPIKSCDSLSNLPYESRPQKREMGCRAEKEKEMYSLSYLVSPERFPSSCDMRIKGMPIDPRQVQCWLAVGKRVNRIRSLGNAVVPQIVEVIGRAIMAQQRIYDINR